MSIQNWDDLKNRQEVTNEEVVKFYDSWAATYDESVEKSASADIALKAVLSQFPHENEREKLKFSTLPLEREELESSCSNMDFVKSMQLNQAKKC